MKLGYLKTVFIFGASQAIAVAAAIFRIPFILNHLGTLNFGLLVTLIQVFSLLNILVVSSRIKTRINLALTISNIESYNQLLSQNFSKALRFLSIVFFNACLVYIFIILPLCRKQNMFWDITFIYFIFLLLTCSTLLFGTLFGFYDSMGKQNFISGLDVISSIVSLPLTGIGLFLDLNYVFFLFVASLTFIVPGFIIAFKEKNRIKYSKHSKREVFIYLKENLLFSGQNIGSILSNGLNIFLISKFTGFVNAGQYSICEKILSATLIPNGALAPLQYSDVAKKSNYDKEIANMFKKNINILRTNMVLSSMFTAVLSILFPYIFQILSHDMFETPRLLGIFMALNYLSFAFLTSFFPIMSIHGSKKEIVMFPLINGSITLVLAALLTFRIGIYGPPISGILMNSISFLYLIKQYYLAKS